MTTIPTLIKASLLCASLTTSAYSQDLWRQLDPENTLVIDSTKGRLIIEMRPEMAPKGVERIKLLAREKIYDGLQFHRVIAGFVAQTGNPNNKDDGRTNYANLAPEMVFRYKLTGKEVIASERSDETLGFLGSVPFQALAISDKVKKGETPLRSWGAHCAGAAGMGRGEARDSANSEMYFMLDATRRLDRDYTVFGRVVVGMDVLLKLNHGEPPANPDIMKSARILADLPVNERPKVSVASDAALRAVVEKTRKEKGADFSICDVVVPAKVE